MVMKKFDEKLNNAKRNVHISTLDKLSDPKVEKRIGIILTIMSVVTGTIAIDLVNSSKQK